MKILFMRGAEEKHRKIWDSFFAQEQKKVSIEKTCYYEMCKGKASENMGQHLCPGENESRMQTWDAVDIQHLVLQLEEK